MTSTDETFLLATITIRQEDEPLFLSAVKRLQEKNNACTYRCINRFSMRGQRVLSYSLDINAEGLDHIKENIDILRLTVTEYTTTSLLGLRIAKCL